MLSNLRDFFSKYGYWKEPFRDYLFFGKVQVTTYHTTFFLKDYELNSFIYVLGVETLTEGAFSRLKDLSKELLSTPPDHFLSSFCLVVLNGPCSPLYSSKSLLLGFKGRVEWGVFYICENRFEGPSQMERVSDFLSRLCFKS